MPIKAICRPRPNLLYLLEKSRPAFDFLYRSFVSKSSNEKLLRKIESQHGLAGSGRTGPSGDCSLEWNTGGPVSISIWLAALLISQLQRERG